MRRRYPQGFDQEGSRLVQERTSSFGEGAHSATFDLPYLRSVHGDPSFRPGANVVPALLGRTLMSWKTPKIVEVPVGMEINMYACAARK